MTDDTDADELHRLRARVAELERAAAAPVAGPMQGSSTSPANADILFSAVEKTRMPMIVTDPKQPDNPIIFVNRAFQQLSGYAAHELIGRNCRFLQGPETSPADVAKVREAIAARRVVTVDIVNYHRDGHSFVNELYISPVFDRDGELLYFFGSQVDLTQYREESRKLKQNEEKYRSLFEAIDAGFCVLEMVYDDDGRAIDYRFLETNTAFLAQTGLTDAVGHMASELVPDLERHWFDTYGRVASTRRGVRFENVAQAMGRVYDVHAYPIGRPADNHVAVLFNDISTRKRVEADLKALNETLEQQVQKRTDQLMLSEEALRQSQKMEAIGQLTGGVAHDFNNLLTIIGSAAEILQRPDLSDERRDRYVAAIADTTQRAANLTGQLLAFARRQPLRAEVFDVGERLDRVADLIHSLVGPGVTIARDGCAPGECLVEADPGQFETALVNLAVNARDAMDGAGELRFHAREVDAIPPLRNHPRVDGRFIAISVIDQGSGIAAGDLERIFEPFYTTKEVGKGTGLGLSQVFGFAKQSGGDIAVSSDATGTTFVLYLSACAAVAAGAVPGTDEGTVPTPAPGACVLLVEDNADVGAFSREMLHDLGYRTVWVTDADAALAELAHGADRFDLVFSDVVMPGMNGVDLGLAIRRDHPRLPVILTSGYSTVLADEGTHGFELVRKPYQADVIARTFARVLAAAGAA